MKRRAVLGSTAGLAMGALAGCVGLTEPTQLSNPTVSTDDGEVLMRFGESGDPLARATLMYDANPRASDMVASMKYRMWHRDGSTVNSLRLSMRGPPAGHKPPASVFIAIPNNAEYPDVSLYSAPDSSARIIEIEDLGTLGRGTFGLDFFLVPYADDRPLPVRVGMESAVSEAGLIGGDYVLDGVADIEIPME